MAPIFFKHLTIVPDTEILLDGHPILTYNYHLFQSSMADNDTEKQVASVGNGPIRDPNYFGFISFENPGKLVTYNSPGDRSLDSVELQEVISYLSELREKPQDWHL